MIEPRCSLLHVHRRNLSKAGGTNEVFHAVFAAGVEPERPIHPALEYEVLFYEEDDDEGEEEDNHDVGIIPPYAKIDDKIDTAESSLPASQDQKTSTSRRIKLLLSFVLLLFSGTGTVVSMKLQAVPMYNYPNFLNLLCHFCYIPLCFLYIVPMIRYGSSITPEQIASSRKPFMIMGALDCLASTLQIFASIYVPGNLLVLLPQAVIPCSMALSHLLLGERYHRRQYIGALVVLLGLLVVLEPVFTFEHSPDFYCEAIDTDSDCTLCRTENTQRSCMSHFQPSGDDDLGEHSPVQNICQWLSYQQATKKEEELTLGWSLLLLASAIPMTLSAMYKQAALDVAEMDPVYLNGWIAIFQFLFALLVAVPAAWMTRVTPLEVPRNMWDGLLCFLGQGSLDSGCHPDECSSHTPVLVGSYLLFAMLYSTSMLCVLKYGSTSALFMAQTILVPAGNLAFSSPLFQHNSPLYTSDLLGLVVILSGLILYRFWGEEEPPSDEQSQGTSPWVQQLIQVQGQTPSSWYLDMVEHLRTQIQQTGNTPWLNDLLLHMREPLLQE